MAGQRGKGELQISDETAVDAVVPPDAGTGRLELDDPRVLGEGTVVHEPHLLEETPADQHDRFRPSHACPDRALVARHAVAEVRVLVGEVEAGGEHVGVDGSAGRLRERHRLRHRVGPCDPVAADDHHLARRAQNLRRFGESAGIGQGAVEDPRRRHRRVPGALLHHVQGQRHEHRPGRRLARDLEGAVEDQGQLVGALGLHRPLGERRRHRHQIVAEHGLAQAQASVLLPRRHQQGRIALPRVVDRAESVAEPGRDMEVHHPHRVGRERIGVGHGDRHALVQAEHVVDVRVVVEAVDDGKLGGPRIAEDVPDSLRHQGVHEDLLAAVAQWGLLDSGARSRRGAFMNRVAESPAARCATRGFRRAARSPPARGRGPALRRCPCRRR